MGKHRAAEEADGGGCGDLDVEVLWRGHERTWHHHSERRDLGQIWWKGGCEWDGSF